MSRNGSVPRIQHAALGIVRKNLLIAEKSGERAKSESDQPPAGKLGAGDGDGDGAGARTRTRTGGYG